MQADRHCDGAQLHVTSYTAVTLLYSTNSWCRAAQSANNADQVRSLLHLPPVNN